MSILSCHKQAVKNNLLSDVLKPAKPPDLQSRNVGGYSNCSPPRPSESDNPSGRHGDGHDHRHRSPGSASLLTQLISDVTRRVVEHTDEVIAICKVYGWCTVVCCAVRVGVPSCVVRVGVPWCAVRVGVP